MIVSMEYNSTLSYVTYLNKTPIITMLSLMNDEKERKEGISLRITWDNKIVEDWTEEGIELDAGESLKFNFERKPLKVVATELASMTEGYDMSFLVEVTVGSEKVYEKYFPIHVLAYDQWLGSNYHPALIAAFVTPNHPVIRQLVQSAGQILTGWNLAFTGYQTQDKNDVRAQMKALYLAIQREAIAYVSAMPSFEKSGQRIRLAEDVLANRMGNCIELSALYAACLEYVGLNPLIILLEGHAFVGCWLEDQSFQSSIDDDETTLRKRLAKGMQTIEIVETTVMTAHQTVEYEAAVAKAEEQIFTEDTFEYLLDVKKARSLGIKPIPQKVELLSDVPFMEQGTREGLSLESQMPQSIVDSENLEITSGKKRNRLQVWESKLLNLTLRNNLLNFRPTRKSISILEGDLRVLEDNLSSGKEFSLVACPPEMEAENRKEKEYSYTRALKDEYREYMNTEMKSGRLVTLLNEDELTDAIKSLYYTSRTELEENGANTLFVAIGFLKWFETDLSKQPRFAPILLYPVELIRKSSLKGYVIRFRDEEVQVNTTLLEKMRMELNLEFPGLTPLPTDEHGIDIQKVLNTFRTAILDKKGWDVIEVSYIGLFSFNQFVMWNDIHSRNEELMSNPIVGSLMQGSLDFQSPAIIPVEEVDKTEFFEKNAVLMDADSSQLRAVYSATEGSSFVLHGPPGTGKSQTITNIIASALYNNKSVLFVAEKMAALNVVQSRLEKIGLGDFALELHSNKTKKTEVLAKIGRVLERRENGSIKEIQKRREHLLQCHNQIKETAEVLHQIRENQYSIYEMISQYEAQLTQTVYSVSERAARLGKEEIWNLTESMDRLLPIFDSVKPVPQNGLRFIRNAELSFKEQSHLKELILALNEKLMAIRQETGKISLPEGAEKSFLLWRMNLEVQARMFKRDDLIWHYLLTFGREEVDTSVTDILLKGQKQQLIYRELMQEFNATVLGLDAAQILVNWNLECQKWFLPKWFGQNAIVKRLRAHAKNPALINKETVKAKLEGLAEFQSLGKDIESFMARNQHIFSTHWQGVETDWQKFSEDISATILVVEKMMEIKKIEPTIDFNNWLTRQQSDRIFLKQNIKENVLEINQRLQETDRLKEQIQELTKDDNFIAEESLEEIIEKLQRIIYAYPNMDKWLAYLQIRNEFTKSGLEAMMEKLESEEIKEQDFKAITLKSLMYHGVLELLETKNHLSTFNHHNFEYLLEQYRKELKIVTEMIRLELIEKLTANIPQPSGDVNAGSELGVLKKAVKNGGRGLSLRKLFDMTPNVLRKIAPCMLMSPISIAQYIDPSFPKFDLVIFDEASQVNTHAAVGAIARGNQLIVVGDPNQLPPTSFFKGNFDEEEMEFDETDQESILDECQAISFPELHLKWHYRSKHESLIAFSNSQYYENKLYTFPSFNDLESKVKFVKVEGYYDRSSTKQNMAEAEAIIKEVEKRLSEEGSRKQSLGIVTFSSVQQKLIQTKLEEFFARNPQYEEYAQQLSEEIFVKNLENVQGDERDVILFSVGYGPDKQGKVTMNFGPLNHSEGWKRLNVVVSRSREEMMVFSTLRPEQIDLSRTDALGVAGLKHFLEFAANKNSLRVDIQNMKLHKDLLIDVIAAEIEKAGYSVVKRVGKSNYRIDIGVLSKQNANEFMAAVVIDGYQYHDTPAVRDKIVVQPFMLNRLKWNVIPVWTMDWFKNKRDVLERIKSRLLEIENLQNEGQKETGISSDKENKKETFQIEYVKAQPKKEIYYEMFPLAENQYPKELFYEDLAMPLMVQFIWDMVEFEAPVVEEDAFRRIAGVWGIAQLGSKVTEILRLATQKADVFCVEEADKKVLWKSEAQYRSQMQARRFREDKRKFAYICRKEIEATILEILSEQISLDFKNLCREVFKFHGYMMMGDEAQSIVNTGLQSLIGQNEIRQEEDKFIRV